MFQKYRNCVLHSSYIFNEQERQSVEKDVIYALIYILGILMSEETGIENRKFMQEYLNDSQYAILLQNPIYNHELYNFLKKEYEDLYTCPYCSTRTMTIDYKCARCFNTFIKTAEQAPIKFVVFPVIIVPSSNSIAPDKE